ncbi:MAG: DUF805 domain-containing protein [Luteibaculaceae bacterium]
MNPKENFFSYEGRIGRLAYLGRNIILTIPAVAVNLVDFERESSSFYLLSLIAVGSFVLIMLQNIKRLHDINLSGWYSVLLFVPLINLFLSLFLLFKPGTTGPNAYGNSPKNGGGGGNLPNNDTSNFTFTVNDKG